MTIYRTCNMCNEAAFCYTKTTIGPWANLCTYHYELYGTELITYLANVD